MINNVSHFDLEFAPRLDQLRILRMEPGVTRRSLILDMLDGCYIIVNAKYQWNLDKDQDLKYLMKKRKN